MLDQHNHVRSTVAEGRFTTLYGKKMPQAANMYKMQYSCSLEMDADDEARKCLGNSFSPTFRKNGKNVIGISAASEDSSLEALNTMVQAETAQLGCSIQLCKPRDKASFYSVVCRYSRPHVKTRVTLYLTGKPCSKCRKGFKCDQITKLCVS
ncbi:SCP-like protein [Dictyocaulus viviparus]|uniref:SCP-like protein n=1 Tax=Dictyocaulus viviparus TaxID=29172 RepID=A0A0D8X9P2_DICVI|nr:SCP-like protein [Dictyocaulus viviparus]